MHDRNAELGCAAIVPALFALHPQTASLVVCAPMIRPEFASAKFSGPASTPAASFVVRKGAETENAEIARGILTAYETGYAMGFSHVHDALPGDLDRIREAVRYGCKEHVLAENRQAPLGDDQIELLAAQCEPIASDSVATYVNELAKQRASH